MTLRQKLIFAGVVALPAAALAPVAWSALATSGYFYDGRCAAAMTAMCAFKGMDTSATHRVTKCPNIESLRSAAPQMGGT